MPIPKYSVLAGRASDRKFATTASNHYEIRIEAAGASYRIAVNVQSADGSEVLFAAKDPFAHPILTGLAALADGRYDVASQPAGLAIDFTRGAFVTKDDMVSLPATSPGDDNDLNDKVDALVQRAISHADARVYAFGSFFKDNVKDKYFGFKPGQGIHDVHMNQGNDSGHRGDDGIWSDGALLFHYPSENRWAAIFLAFRNQSWTTDAQGHATLIDDGHDDEVIVTSEPLLRIVAARPNSIEDPEIETVTLVNISPAAVNLTGWSLADKSKNKFALAGALASGEALRVTITVPMALSNKGDQITLSDPSGKTVHSVSYSKAEASRPGWTVVF
jgi:uncharacterized protein YukJ